ncbi:hypothetical protein FOCC_FOCC011563 [Frankliniella occidentalis]|nr:hypothetical protein FOCC_FOCC011563 [Frankliniella occidentalis]
MASDTDDASDSDSELLLHDTARVSPAALRRRLSGRRPSTAAAPRTTTTATTTLLSARHQCSVCAVSPAASPLIPKRGQSLEAACGAQAAQDGGLPRQTSFPPYMRRRACKTATVVLRVESLTRTLPPDTKSIMASTPPPAFPTEAEHAAGEELPSKDKRFKFVAERSRTVSSVLLALKSSSNFQSQTVTEVAYRHYTLDASDYLLCYDNLLRTVVFGDAATPPRSEWSRTGLVMREPERDLGYGLRAPRNGTRGLLAVVQAYLVKHLLFEAPPGMEGAGPPTARPEE